MQQNFYFTPSQPSCISFIQCKTSITRLTPHQAARPPPTIKLPHSDRLWVDGLHLHPLVQRPLNASIFELSQGTRQAAQGGALGAVHVGCMSSCGARHRNFMGCGQLQRWHDQVSSPKAPQRPVWQGNGVVSCWTDAVYSKEKASVSGEAKVKPSATPMRVNCRGGVRLSRNKCWKECKEEQSGKATWGLRGRGRGGAAHLMASPTSISPCRTTTISYSCVACGHMNVMHVYGNAPAWHHIRSPDITSTSV